MKLMPGSRSLHSMLSDMCHMPPLPQNVVVMIAHKCKSLCSQQCWHYPDCCTKDYCPAVNATRDWLKMGGWRIDTGYPYGDGMSQDGSMHCSHSTTNLEHPDHVMHTFCDPAVGAECKCTHEVGTHEVGAPEADSPLVVPVVAVLGGARASAVAPARAIVRPRHARQLTL